MKVMKFYPKFTSTNTVKSCENGCTCVVSATHLPVSGPASLECSTVAGTPTFILCKAAGWSIYKLTIEMILRAKKPAARTEYQSHFGSVVHRGPPARVVLRPK